MIPNLFSGAAFLSCSTISLLELYRKSPAVMTDLCRSAGMKKKTSLQACLFCTITLRSDGALNLVGAEASRTDVNMAGSAVNDSLDALHVRLPRTVGTSVGVRNLDAKRDTLAAKIALCQLLHLQSSQNHALDRAKRRLYIIAKKSQECKGKIEKMQKNFPFGDFPEFARKKRKNGCQTYRKPL